MRETCSKARLNGRKVGLVPTMGALHEGHLSLIRRVKELADVVVVSIFVNPTQFDKKEDLERYPRDLAGDVDLCVAEEVDYVFAPSKEEMYPEGSRTHVEVAGLSDVLEGASRPGHFRGVATVVMKLFQVVQPTLAAFGQKDAQQAAVIRRMVLDLMLDLEILVLPTIRDDDGLALSSRNRRLSHEARSAALAIPRALEAASRVVAEGTRQADKVLKAAREPLEAQQSLELDYLELVDGTTFSSVQHVDGECLLVVAATVGGVRLLDNTPIGT